MSSVPITRILPATLVRAIVSVPLMLLATTLRAAHAEHPTATDLALQVLLVLFMAALLVNVIVSVVAILRERHVADPQEGGAAAFVSELKPRAGPTAPQGHTPSVMRSPSEHTAAQQILSEP